MTKEDKGLLLKDLSARLPYGVKCHFKYGSAEDDITLSCIDNNVARFEYGWYGSFHVSIDADYIKPYLRPMSSMTEEECDMVEEILGDKCIFDFMSNGDIVLKQGQFSQNKLAKLYDYYTSIHIDYRGLIPKGLALKAPEGMYKIN